MQFTRRNTLIGLAAIAGGAGVIGGTGAFDSVQANRSFEVGVDGDAAALLALEATNDQIADTEAGGAGDNQILVFTLTGDDSSTGEDAINEDAVTWFFDAFSITNNGSREVDVSIDLGDAEGVDFVVESEELSSLSSDVNLVENTVTLPSGNGVSVNISINTRSTSEDSNGGYTEPGADPYEMTITAESDRDGPAT